MHTYSEAAWERTVKVQDVILRAVARRITWCQAAEIGDLRPHHEALEGAVRGVRL